MTSFEEAARRCEEAARLYRNAGSHSGDVNTRNGLIQRAEEELQAAKTTATKARMTLDSLRDSAVRRDPQTVKDRILALLPVDRKFSIPVRLVRSALTEQGCALDDSNLRRHLRRLEADGLVLARQHHGQRIETCYWLAPTHPPSLRVEPLPKGGPKFGGLKSKKSS